MLVAVPVVLVAPHTAGATSDPNAATLEPGVGQYTPIDPVEIYDTRNGTGGAPSSLAAGATSSPIPVLGVSGLPTTGVEAVFVNIQVLSASGSGYLTDYEADDSANPGQASVSYGSGLAESGSDVVTIAPPGSTNAGDILVTNNGSATITLAIQVEGYFQDGSQSSPGDTYMSVTSTNLVTNDSVPADSTSKFNLLQDAENDGLIASQDAGNVDAFQIEVGTINPSGYGYLNFIGGNTYCNNPGAGTGVYVNITSSLRQMTYQPNEKDRLTDIIQPELSTCNSTSYADGDIQVVNGGSSAVTIQIALDGYFINPTTTDIAGSEYTPIPNGPIAICDTRVNDPDICQDENGNLFSGAVPAGQSITVQEAGLDGIPAAGMVSEVADEVDAVNPSSTGWLTVTPYGAGPSTVPVVNFSSSYPGADVSFQNTVVTPTSSSGAITIYNNSPSGTVQVVVSARGYWLTATTPDPPSAITTQVANGVATVAWGEPDDNGSPIDSYVLDDVTTNTTVTVPGDYTNSAQIAVSAPSDQLEITAVNCSTISSGVCTGSGSPSSQFTADGSDGTPQPTSWPVTVSGYLYQPNNQAAPDGITVNVYDNFTGEAGTGTDTMPIIGSAVTSGGAGFWSFQLSSMSSLPSITQQEIAQNNGNLNVLAVATAFASDDTTSTSYGETAAESGVVYVGDGTTGNASTGPIVMQLAASDPANQPTEAEVDSNFSDATNPNVNLNSTTEPTPTGLDSSDALSLIQSSETSDALPSDTATTAGSPTGDMPGPAVQPNVAADGTDLSTISSPVTAAPLSTDTPQAGNVTEDTGLSYPQWFQECQNAVTEYWGSAPYDGIPGDYWLADPVAETVATNNNAVNYMPVGYYDSGTDDTSQFDFGQGVSDSESIGFSISGKDDFNAGWTSSTVNTSTWDASISSKNPETEVSDRQDVQVMAWTQYSLYTEKLLCAAKTAGYGNLYPYTFPNGYQPVPNPYRFGYEIGNVNSNTTMPTPDGNADLVVIRQPQSPTNNKGQYLGNYTGDYAVNNQWQGQQSCTAYQNQYFRYPYERTAYPTPSKGETAAAFYHHVKTSLPAWEQWFIINSSSPYFQCDGALGDSWAYWFDRPSTSATYSLRTGGLQGSRISTTNATTTSWGFQIGLGFTFAVEENQTNSSGTSITWGSDGHPHWTWPVGGTFKPGGGYQRYYTY
jgi:hypothetical protein